MSSTKNQLQEIWQRHGDVLPRYETKRLGGTDHAPVYESVVTLPDEKQFVGAKEGSRTSAELSAAAAAVEYSKTVSLKRKAPYRKISKHNSLIFVDLENIPKAVSLIDYVGARFCVGFVSKKHPLATSAKNRMRTYVVKSYAKDAADFALAMTIAMFVSSGRCDQYTKLIILTKDHYGLAVTDILKQWWGIDAYHAMTVHDCLDNVI